MRAAQRTQKYRQNCQRLQWVPVTMGMLPYAWLPKFAMATKKLNVCNNHRDPGILHRRHGTVLVRHGAAHANRNRTQRTISGIDDVTYLMMPSLEPVSTVSSSSFSSVSTECG